MGGFVCIKRGGKKEDIHLSTKPRNLVRIIYANIGWTKTFSLIIAKL